MLDAPWIAVLYALFLWWFSTGAILWLVRRGGGARAALWALPLLAAGGWALWQSLSRTDAAGAYMGFAAALAIWGWIELAFLSGLITGPNAYRCPDGAPRWERFIRAWGTIAYNEILLVMVLVLLLLISRGEANAAGAGCFALLFAARISAKLNLFFGVARVNTEFLPAHLAHLPSHFRRAGMNWLFPLSVTALAAAAGVLIARAGAAPLGPARTADILLASLTALALLEHWLLVLPLPDARLWRWMLPDADTAAGPLAGPRTAKGEKSHGL